MKDSILYCLVGTGVVLCALSPLVFIAACLYPMFGPYITTFFVVFAVVIQCTKKR